VVGLLTDPLWSTVLGFVAVHELKQAKLIGPVAEDVLYAGIITVNAARTPGIANAIGSSLGLEGLVTGGLAGGAAGKLAAGSTVKAAAGGTAGGALAAGKVAGMSLAGTAGAVGGGILASAGAMKAVELALPKEVRPSYKKLPLWQRYLLSVPLFQGTMTTLVGQRLFRKKKKK
jgi:hypothetical protein